MGCHPRRLTPLEGAAMGGQLDIVQLLLNLGPNTNCDAIDLTRGNGYRVIAEALYGALGKTVGRE